MTLLLGLIGALLGVDFLAVLLGVDSRDKPGDDRRR